jgi:hypothetical protein
MIDLTKLERILRTGIMRAGAASGLIAAIRVLDEAHKSEQSYGPEQVSGLTRPDDLSASGLPGNLGKLHMD